uniref:FAR1 domain-containing protein n=1 Tax=Plectus sambesii TaxID=2011161 RepID=A0A914V994_9BILA
MDAIQAHISSVYGASHDQFKTEVSTDDELDAERQSEASANSEKCEEPMEDARDGEIRTGSKFVSFAEFDEAFERWKVANHHPFRVASSETLRMPDGTTNDSFKYRYIVYHCAHYGAPRMRGVGKRPNQNYLPCGCRAMLRLNYSWSENALRITTLNSTHTGHDISADSYNKFAAKVRRPSPGLTPERVPAKRPAGHHQQQQVERKRATPALSLASNASSNPSPVPSPKAPPPAHLPLNIHQKENELLAANARLLPLLSGILGLPSLPASYHHYSSFVAQQQLQHQQESAIVTPGYVAPLDLSASNDQRSDEERFQEMHVTLQAVTDHLMQCRGAEFDAKLKQMRLVLKAWDVKLDRL